jgi:RHS repeat-associated protein
MSVYESGNSAINNGHLSQTEVHLYGSRLGLWRRNLAVADRIESDPPDPTKISIPLLGMADSITFVRGDKLFELSNHLGNVLATVSDKKFGVTSGGSSLIDHYEPQIVSAQDYYPFGMLQPGRSYNAGGYRYGFNGKENDNEVKGVGQQQDYGFRIYDPRIGKFLSVDPLTKDYSELTPYQFASNRPIDGVDLDGGEWMPITEWLANKAKANGYPTLSGFIRSFGGLDIQSQTQQLTDNAINGNYRAVAKQLYGYSLKSMVDNLEETTKRAIDDNDPEAYGQLYGFIFQGALGDAAMGELPTKPFKFSEHPVAKTNKVAIEAHGSIDAGKGNAANITTNRVNTIGKGTGSKGWSTIKAKELKLVHNESTILKSADYKKISKLSDKELIESVTNPSKYDPVTINTKTGKLVDGNTRIYEIQRRGLDVNVPVKEYTPNDSGFPELKEPPKKQ